MHHFLFENSHFPINHVYIQQVKGTQTLPMILEKKIQRVHVTPMKLCAVEDLTYKYDFCVRTQAEYKN